MAPFFTTVLLWILIFLDANSSTAIRIQFVLFAQILQKVEAAGLNVESDQCLLGKNRYCARRTIKNGRKKPKMTEN